MADAFTLYTYANHLLIDTQDDGLGMLRWPYLVFNSLEALVWFACAVYVIVRWRRHGRGPSELYYALAYAAFGLSDVIETYGTTPLLLLFKGACILALIGFRGPIRQRYGSRWV